ncbi:Csu type fimbrial protein [Cupriavidus necator]|uniref:Csu type fimbrial protein n=1 Tax=Cupriavidus necator TaxID=106590 RepID=UPI002784AC66|nr:spore coat U domain-containing protein [Cupriavidus necator]MDQ0139009.1 spore coat protein U-like protein [Cupriavidus necator]
MNYAGYALLAPSCTTVTSPVARFPFTVSATVIPDCVTTATDLDFGTTGTLTAARTGTATLTARCTHGSHYTTALGAGTSAGGSAASRRLQRTGGTEPVDFQLYSDAAYALPWGDGTGGTATQGGTGTGLSQAYTVYGRVPTQATPVAGTYADTITVTITC